MAISIQNSLIFKIGSILDQSFLKNTPVDVGISNNSMEKLKINPFGQDKAVLKCILKKWCDIDNRRFMFNKR